MATLGQLKTRIARELDRTDLDAEISDSVRTALDFYRAERLYFNEGMSEMDTSAGQSEYPLPEDYAGLWYMMITAGRYTYELSEQSYHWLDIHDSDTENTGLPRDYAIFDQQFRLEPTPDDVYRLRLMYTRALELSASDSAVNAWITEAEELIRLHAKVDLLVNRIRGQEAIAEAQGLRSIEADVLQKIRRESNQRTKASGKLHPVKF